MVPNAVLFDRRLTDSEQRTYTKLVHIAWEHREDRGDSAVHDRAIQLPATTVLAEHVGCSDSALRYRLRKLVNLGFVSTFRPSRRQPLKYVFHSDPSPPESRRTQDAESACQPADSEGLLPIRYEEGSSNTHSLTGVSDGDVSELGDPPSLPRFGKHSLAFDILAEVTGVNLIAHSPRGKEVGVALHGDKRQLDIRPGINRLFWLEVARSHNVSPEAIRQRAEANPVGYETALIEEIKRRANIYREAMSGATLTPTALAKWWSDLAALQTARGLSPDEIERIADEVLADRG